MTAAATSPQRRQDRVVLALLAFASYVPILLSSPGKVSADTKSYLTIDPGDVVSTAASMWDPTVGAGTVPHQNIGYLFPLGPFYWLMERLAVPDWLTQRLLWGTLVFAAAWGTYRLLRWMGWRPVVAVVAAFAYGFSPYLLSYLARLSVILGPWSALPWLILLAAKAARTRSWRPAALFALIVALVGSVNATALVLAGLGPVLWLVADVVSGRVATRQAVRAAARIGVLSAVVSVWWVAALRIQGNFGIPILRYTETYETVAGASTPLEVSRGLGYWFFYGGDRLDQWVGPSAPYVDNVVLIALGFTLAGIALLGLLRPFVGRAVAAVLLLVGLAVSVGAAPRGDSTPYGRFFDWFASETTAGLALRSTPRAAPLVVLAMAMGLASSTEWLRARIRARIDVTERRWDLAAPVAMIGLLGVQLFPWFTADPLTPSILRDETLPGYVTDMASWLDETAETGSGGRVWEIPAADFANHRWGGTIDPVLPGLIDRPYLARELVPQGGAATADLLNAFERRLPEGWFEPETLAAVARRFGVETVVMRNDIEHERYRLARPDLLWTEVTSALGEPDEAGPLIEDTPVIPVLDERTLAHPEAADRFPAVAAFDLGAAPAVVARSTASPIVLVGSGEGVVDLAGTSLMEESLGDAARPLLYAATLGDLAAAGDFDEAMLGTDPWWVISDTNRKQGRHWSTVSSNLGALEAAGPVQLDDDPGDNRLDVFATNGLERQTIAVHEADVADVRASYYGNRIAYTPEDAPWFAIDGDPATAWRAGVFDTTEDLVWEVDLVEPVSTSTITLLQPVTGAVNRYLTEVRVVLDDATSVDVMLGDDSRTVPGQTIELPVDEFSSMRIEVLADNVGRLSGYGAQPGVGLAEVTIPGVIDDRAVRLPTLTDVVDVDEAALAEQRITYLLTRERIDPATSNRTSPELRMVRRFDVVDDRIFELTGEARLSADADERLLAAVLGDDHEVVADRRLPGSPASRGASAFDGDVSTAWQTPFGSSVGALLDVQPGPVEPADSVTVTWLDDGRHSVPTELSILAVDGRSHTVALPATEPVDGVASAVVAVDALAPGPVSITVTAVDERTSPEYFSGFPQVLPIGIAEIQIGAQPDSADGPTALDDRCRDDLLLLDGVALPVRLVGTTDAALGRDELAIEACAPVELAAGTHRIDAAAGGVSGFDIDRLVLDGQPAGVRPAERAAETAVPDVVVESETSTSYELAVAASPESSWLVLQQSWNPGWTATVDGEDLGAPVLIDGYANGWLLPASASERTVQLEWTPQGTLRVALWFSLAAGIGVLALALLSRRADVRLVADDGDEPDDRPDRAGARRRLRRDGPVMAVGLVAVVLVVAGPWVALASLVPLLSTRRWHWLPAALVVATGAVAAGAVVVLQLRFDYPIDPSWPSRFGWTSTLVWVAVTTATTVALMPDGVRRRADTGSV